MSVENRPTPMVDRVIHAFSDWLKYRRELSELRQLNTPDFDRIAGELRVSPADLNELVHQGPHAADELPKLLALLGIDQAGLARSEPLVLRDMERVCALCQHKRQCDRDLAAGSSVENYEEYCLNAPTLDLLGGGRPANIAKQPHAK